MSCRAHRSGVSVSGGFEFAAEGLQASLRLDPDAVIRGTPSVSELAAAPYLVTVNAVDDLGAESSESFTLTLDNPLGFLFVDGFERGDTGGWSRTVP